MTHLRKSSSRPPFFSMVLFCEGIESSAGQPVIRTGRPNGPQERLTQTCVSAGAPQKSGSRKFPGGRFRELHPRKRRPRPASDPGDAGCDADTTGVMFQNAVSCPSGTIRSRLHHSPVEPKETRLPRGRSISAPERLGWGASTRQYVWKDSTVNAHGV